MKTVEITVDAQGVTTVATKGFTGPSCREASRPYEEALGATTAERVTAAFHLAQEPADRSASRAESPSSRPPSASLHHPQPENAP